MLVVKYVADSRADTYNTKVHKTSGSGRKAPSSGEKPIYIDSGKNYNIKIKTCLYNSRVSMMIWWQLFTISRATYKPYQHS